ncbi:MAG: hypothetical protein KDM63_21325, partial [Verrucomicrobiae bacterium]|nr:hypothetical protein [Verrucomicrobiae bacterium]
MTWGDSDASAARETPNPKSHTAKVSEKKSRFIIGFGLGRDFIYTVQHGARWHNDLQLPKLQRASRFALRTAGIASQAKGQFFLRDAVVARRNGRVAVDR